MVCRGGVVDGLWIGGVFVYFCVVWSGRSLLMGAYHVVLLYCHWGCLASCP